MTMPRKYMAGWVPRYIRQTKLGYLPIDSVICTQNARSAESGVNNYTDLVMLPVQDFERMRSAVGLQHVLAPALSPMKIPGAAFIIRDPRQVTVPANHPDPKAYARSYFLKNYGVMTEEQLDAEAREDV